MDSHSDKEIKAVNVATSFVAIVSAGCLAVWAFVIWATPTHSAPSEVTRPGEPVAVDRIEWQGCVVCYDRRTRTPRWAMETLTKASLIGGAPRSDAFHEEQSVPKKFRSHLQDYLNTGWQRGHCAPSADFEITAEANRASFSLANIFPQDGELNRTLWARLEQSVRDVAQQPDVARVWVVTVPLWLPPANDPATHAMQPITVSTIGHAGGRVAVPTHIGKSVLSFDGTRYVLHSYVVPNAAPPTDAKLDDYLTPTDVLERQAGLDLWPSLPAELQQKLEAMK
jgi:endonuclease G